MHTSTDDPGRNQEWLTKYDPNLNKTNPDSILQKVLIYLFNGNKFTKNVNI